MPFTEFCCRSGGSNMNGGGLNSNAEPATTPVYSFTNGGWNSGTGVYTPTSGNPSLTATVGDWASVFIDGATTPVFIGRVTAVSSTTVTVSTTIKSGTAPTTAGAGISINVGGAWLGPTGAVGFPFTFVTGAMVGSATGARQRVNFKNDQTSNVTANMSVNAGSSQTPVTFQGYTTTFGDGGRAVIDGGTTGASYTVLTLNNNAEAVDLVDLIFDHNGSTGSADLVSYNRGLGQALRCTFRNAKGKGVNCPFGNGYSFILCDAYLNGGSGFFAGQGANLFRCAASRNTTNGFDANGYAALVECLAVANGSAGFNMDGGMALLVGCNAYLNGGDGFFVGWKYSVQLINCNAISNGAYGVNGFAGSIPKSGMLQNCGFFGNVSGATNTLGAIVVANQITYGSQPFTDPANGDYRIGGAGGSAASQAGYGAFQWADTNYSARANNVSYPDVGMIQMQAAAGGGPVAQLKSFGRGNPY